MNVEWDRRKDLLNTEKHGVSFTDASKVIEDPFHISILVRRCGYFDEIWVSLGYARAGIIVVGHSYKIAGRGEGCMKIYSARVANPKEREEYERIR